MVLSISEERYGDFQKETIVDPELQAVLTMKRVNGWPDTKQPVAIEARPYRTFSDKVATADGLLFKGTRLIIPKVMRPEILCQIHKCHLGIAKCRQSAREVLFWPGISLDVEQIVSNCSLCADFAEKQPMEPLKPTALPSLPWQKIGTDLFEFWGEHYLLSACYHSKFPEGYQGGVFEKQCVVVEELKRQFGVHGISAEVVSVNDPQFSSSEFQEFAKEY